MTDTTLLIDQGNTQLKWIIALNGSLQEASAGQGNLEAFIRACRAGNFDQPDSILVSSVAGAAAAQELGKFCESQWALKPQRLISKEQSGGVRNGYSEAEKLGVDRWLAIVGAVKHHGKPIVIWDLGTATTLDAVDETGQHIGGMIYPGPATMLRSLASETNLAVPENLAGTGLTPGRSTAGCIANGVFAAQVGALNQFLRNLPEGPGEKPKLVITGGAAGAILPLLDFRCIHDPWLVFRGMLAEGVR